jgi:SAM-dependent methyltransferase
MGSTLEHLTFPDEKIKEVHRILKPGGVFYGTVPYGRADGSMYVMEHRQFFTEKSFDMFCADAQGRSRCEYLFPAPLFQMSHVRLKAEANTWRTRLRCLIPFRPVLTYFVNNMYDDVDFKLIKIEI